MGACNSQDDDDVPAAAVTRQYAKTQDFGRIEERVMTNRKLPKLPGTVGNKGISPRNSKHNSRDNGFAPPPSRPPTKAPNKPLPQRPNHASKFKEEEPSVVSNSWVSVDLYALNSNDSQMSIDTRADSSKNVFTPQ